MKKVELESEFEFSLAGWFAKIDFALLSFFSFVHETQAGRPESETYSSVFTNTHIKMSTDAAARGRGGFGQSFSSAHPSFSARALRLTSTFSLCSALQAEEVLAPEEVEETPEDDEDPDEVAERTRTRSGAFF